MLSGILPDSACALFGLENKKAEVGQTRRQDADEHGLGSPRSPFPTPYDPVQ
jgi:hypothetical protein